MSHRLYCLGCNQEFESVDLDARCPQCRENMTVPPVTPTSDLEQTLTLDPGAQLVFDLRQQVIDRPFAGYDIESFLGKGGMAWVFLARHQALHRRCAIKILSPDLHDKDEQFLDLFVSEARTAASVVHPHIVTVHNIGEFNGNHFIELEFVAGNSLQELLLQESRMSPMRATGFLLQACSALAEAHSTGLIHRDFKPSNILVGHNEFTKLADFGLAKRIAKRNTASEGLTGTPYFMAPELYRGESATTASDVYAVGVSIYRLLTGAFPFTDRSVVKLGRLHREAPVPDPRAVCDTLPDDLCEFIRRCLAKRPEDRPQDGAVVHRELNAIFHRLRDFKTLVTEAFAGLEAEWECGDSAAWIHVRFDGGRSQRVFVEDRTSGSWSEQIVKIYSVCCRVDEGYLRKALELNSDISHGCLAIESYRGEPHFVVANNYPRATCDPEEIRFSVLDIAAWADRVEEELTGADQN